VCVCVEGVLLLQTLLSSTLPFHAWYFKEAELGWGGVGGEWGVGSWCFIHDTVRIPRPRPHPSPPPLSRPLNGS
jgi:hypothetical protein